MSASALQHNVFMVEADRLARINLETGDGGPFGAVVVRDGAIVGRGRNHVIEQHDPTAHGEVSAIRDACANLGTHDLTGCVLYTSCYPCPMCLSACVWANIRTVYYGNTKEDAAAIGFRDDAIYSLIDSLPAGKDAPAPLDIIPCDRDLTIGTFDAYAALDSDASNKAVY